jgi:hypothetical protein
MTRASHCFPLLSLLLVLVTAPSIACAQPGSAFEPILQRRDVHLIADRLDLDNEQCEAVTSLIDEYQQRFRETMREVWADTGLLPAPSLDEADRRRIQEELRHGAQRFREELERQREERGEDLPPEDVQRLHQEHIGRIQDMLRGLESAKPDPAERDAAAARIDEAQERWRAERRRLNQCLIADILTLLTAPQHEQWPGVERALRRARSLPRGQLSGERLDLFMIVRDLRLDAEALDMIQPLLAGYEVQLDEALRRREDHYEQAERNFGRHPGNGDDERALPLIREQVQRHVAVRDVNDAFIRLIAEALPDDEAASFRSAALRRGYARVYATTRGQHMLLAARELPGLDEETKAAVQALLDAYRAEHAALAEQLLVAVRLHEPAAALRRFEGPQGMAARDPLAPLLAQRNDLDRRSIDELERALGLEQFSRLPQARRLRQERND